MATDGRNADEVDISSLSITAPGPPPLSQADATVREYLVKASSAFADVDELRERGWSNPEGDKFYQQKRARTTNSDREAEWKFYNMYKRIADEMQSQTGAFTLEQSVGDDLRALNLCLAPGGYTRKLLDMYKDIKIYGITLSEQDGGHEVLVKNPRLEVEYLDLNLLAFEYGVSLLNVPPEHPDSERFLTNAPFAGLDFGIVVGDGAVLRSHAREEYRQDKDREALRLRVAQLIFGIARIKPGGTFILLLHRIDSWDNLKLLRNFEQFSTIAVFKASKIYTQSSSFYLIAKDVQPDHPVAVKVMEKWKQIWHQTTFGGAKNTGTTPEEPPSSLISQALETYGPRFIELGSPIWKSQAQGLSRASYVQPAPEKKDVLDKYRPPFAYGADESKRFKPYMGTERWFPVGTGLGEPGKKTEGEGAKEEMARMQKVAQTNTMKENQKKGMNAESWRAKAPPST